MFLRFLLLLFLSLLIAVTIQAQTNMLSGLVTEEGTNAPLAFVNVVINNSNKGTTTDIDGRFTLTSTEPITQLRFSFVGYEPVVRVIEPGKTSHLPITMRSTATNLAEIMVVPGENPAHRLIYNVLKNRDRNNPEKIPAFRYRSYNKLVVTAKQSAVDLSDTLRISEPIDSADLEMRNLLDKQHLFMMETVTERDFMAPQHSQEVVLASRMAGFKKANLAFLATDMQPFSFYSDFIDLSGQAYSNPISKGSNRKYDFLLKDTLYSGADSVFVVSFSPKKNRNFDGLKGLLYINTNGWAIQNVQAEPVEGKLKGLRIQQQYEKIEGKQWFPVQLNTDFVVPSVEMGAFRPVAVSRSYITSINLSPGLRKRDFGAAAVKIDPNAGTKPTEFWQQHRSDSLDTLELRTYEMIDSLGQKHNFDAKLRIAESLATGRYPLGLVDLDITRLLQVNRYERLRLGLGLYTSDKLSRFFSVGGWGGYGIRDKAFKYGADATFQIYRPASVQLTVAFAEDLKESGGIFLPFRKRSLLSQKLRYLVIANMDQVETRSVGLSFRTLKFLTMHLQLRQEYKRPTNGYVFESSPEERLSRFRFAESVVGLRYAFREKLAQTGNGFVSMGTDLPVLWLQYTQGLKGKLDGQYSYHKYDARLEFSFREKAMGQTQVELAAGLVQGDVPYPNLYGGLGSYSNSVRIYTSDGFETMAPGEFLSDRYAAVFLRHNFGRLLYRSKKFSPYLSLVTNIGYGSLENPDRYQLVYAEGFPFKTMRKGYYESGLLANDLYRMEYTSFGAGVFYRYGPYQKQELIGNLALKLTLMYSF